LVKRKIEPIIPARKNNGEATHQDGANCGAIGVRWRLMNGGGCLYRVVTLGEHPGAR
jgi:hypothetical protein